MKHKPLSSGLDYGIARSRANDPLAIGVEEFRGAFRLEPVRSPISESHITLNTKMKLKPQASHDKNPGADNHLTRFAFSAAAARQVSLAGDFNEWNTKTNPMHRGPDGVWHLGVALKPGRYEYRFIADDVWYNDPAAQETARNPLGTENCVRIV